MANQENGGIKQLKLRIPMEVYVQLEKDSAEHREAPATRARHILVDQLMHIELTEADKARVDFLIEENWKKINKEG